MGLNRLQSTHNQWPTLFQLGPAHRCPFPPASESPQTNPPHTAAADDVLHRRGLRRRRLPQLRRIRHARRPRKGPGGLLQGIPPQPRPRTPSLPPSLPPSPEPSPSSPAFRCWREARALLLLRRHGTPSTRAWRSTRTRSPPRSPPWGSSTPLTAGSPAPTSSATAAPPG
jgi:hypothetical protein